MWKVLLNFNYEIFLSYLTITTLGISYCTKAHWSGSTLKLREYSNELCLSFAILLVLMLCLFSGELNYHLEEDISQKFYNNPDFITSPFLLASKIFTVLITSSCLLLSMNSIKYSNLPRIEYPFFFLTALLAMLLLISSNHLVYCYLALEFLNFSIYLLLGGKTFSSLANEASQRYFVYSSYASALFLLGIALLYGLFATLNLSELQQLILSSESSMLLSKKMLLSLSLLFLFTALLFKLSIFPFHFWVSEIYEGSPLPSVLFLSSAPKIAILTLWLKITFCLAAKLSFFLPLLQFLALASIAYGTIAALYEYRLKRFLAYSTISNMGFILLAFSLHSIPGFSAGLIYFIIYLITTLALFGLLMQFSIEVNWGKENLALESLELKQLFSLQYYQSHPAYLFAFTLLILSLAGIPPLAGFFIKFYLLQACLLSGNSLAAFLAFLFSVLALTFYLRLLRILFVTPLRLSFSQQSQRSVLLTLYKRPLLVFYFLAILLFVIITYGLLFHNLALFFTTFLALSSGYF